MLQHSLLPKHHIERIDRPEGRQYKLPSGLLVPSVTNVIGSYFKKDLSGWIARVGEAKAEAIKNQAAVKGTALHKITERYVLNDPAYKQGSMPFILELFAGIKPHIDEHVDMIYGVEHPLWSNKLMTAGTTDLLCRWDGRPSVVDIKGSINIKKEEWIENYFVQAATYGIMARSMYEDIDFLDIVIIMAVDHEKPIIY